MRSRHADAFNHDDEAAGYDADVRNEADPVRAGYDALLGWVAAQAGTGAGRRVLDLGAGTGNLTARLDPSAAVVCVDVSAEMLRRAREKLAGRPHVRFERADLLEFFDRFPDDAFDAIVSTYAIHHLTGDEKQALFTRIASRLPPGGRAVFGDLMFESASAREAILVDYRARGRSELARDAEAEFFWNLATDRPALEQAGFVCQTRRYSELSWGVAATRSD